MPFKVLNQQPLQLLVFLLTVASWTIVSGADEHRSLLHHQLPPTADPTARKPYPQKVEAILRRAEAALAAPMLTIVQKTHLAASGDPRDYHSLSIYWWPVTQSDGSVVWQHRDGKRNPAASEYDAGKLKATCTHGYDLALGFRVTGKQKYARRCVEVIDAFFLNPKTGMRPHLRYAQAIPGDSPGNRQGIIEGLPISLQLLDAAILLQNFDGWQTHRAEFEGWVTEFRKWLLESEFGKQEAGRANNHSTWYDVQILSLSVWLDETEFAQKWLSKQSLPRLLKQIVPNGGQPFEAYRSKSFEYSVYNLQGWLAIARISRVLQIEWPSEQIERMDAAIDFLSDLDGGKNWPFRQIRPVNYEQMHAGLLKEWQLLKPSLLSEAAGSKSP